MPVIVSEENLETLTALLRSEIVTTGARTGAKLFPGMEAPDAKLYYSAIEKMARGTTKEIELWAEKLPKAETP